jgi:hypothetical protein
MDNIFTIALSIKHPSLGLPLPIELQNPGIESPSFSFYWSNVSKTLSEASVLFKTQRETVFAMFCK